LGGLAARTLTYGLEPGADITTRKPALSFSGLEFTVEIPIGKIEVRSQLVGRINVYNILAAIGAGVALDLSRDVIANGIAQLSSVPGRFERIDAGQPFLVIVDYAHTDDALRNLLATAKELNPDGRIITLFGCGGDRDRTKRPLMGEAAGRLSDIVVLTSDNPRSEDPLAIIAEVEEGLIAAGRERIEYRDASAKKFSEEFHARSARRGYIVESDRRSAIVAALKIAAPGDAVLIAGKGHEDYQLVSGRVLKFDDRVVVREIAAELGGGQS
jgi:UDP-N-acetylmuramoyl-L-alanyl-D-glutamate--2,6-diaminopimelate ligase